MTEAENGAVFNMFCGSPAPPRGCGTSGPPLIDEDLTALATARLASAGVIPVGGVIPSARTTSGRMTVASGCATACGAAVSIVAATNRRTAVDTPSLATLLMRMISFYQRATAH